MRQELVSMAISGRLAGRLPSFVEDAADQHRQLRAEMSHRFRSRWASHMDGPAAITVSRIPQAMSERQVLIHIKVTIPQVGSLFADERGVGG